MNVPRVGEPTPPILFRIDPTQVRARLAGRHVDVPDTVIDRLRDACREVVTETASLAEVSRDWWPLAMAWALDGQLPALAAIARPGSVDEIADVLRGCNEHRIPVTPAAGRSGVSGGSVPLHGGVLLDLGGLGSRPAGASSTAGPRLRYCACMMQSRVDRHFQAGARHVLIVLDEGDPAVVDGVMRVVREECAGAERLDRALVDHWLEHRNDVSVLQRLVTDGFVVDTIDVAAR
jgi:hypothetical protein